MIQIVVGLLAYCALEVVYRKRDPLDLLRGTDISFRVCASNIFFLLLGYQVRQTGHSIIYSQLYPLFSHISRVSTLAKMSRPISNLQFHESRFVVPGLK